MLTRNTIHRLDCIEAMKQLDAGCVDLAFADPPFNIGYDYDEYDDRKDANSYLDWSREWISGVHRVLKPTGTFWLAIGDDYAAELKVLSQQIGFHCRSWVVWYYTFGVNCKKKFSRSHTHIFHFVKDPENFQFNGANIAIPSARQLVYADARASKTGRLPDDTWILRPQDVTDGFNPDDDVWYFPRVAGTFKEREGFHGCQMPEQLLGRIVKVSSSPDELVLDPFSGSSTTLTVAKKLGRQFIGFEISEDYVARGLSRLAVCEPGDPLDGSPEPTVSAPATPTDGSGKGTLKKSKPAPVLNFEANTPDQPTPVPHPLSDPPSVIEGCLMPPSSGRFAKVPKDFPPTESSPILNWTANSLTLAPKWVLTHRRSFSIERCSVCERPANCNPCRPNGAPILPGKKRMIIYSPARLPGVRFVIRTRQVLTISFATRRSPISSIRLHRSSHPGYSSLQYRWGALKLRKVSNIAGHRSGRLSNVRLPASWLCHDQQRLSALDDQPGLYMVYENGGKPLYAGETFDLGKRLKTHFGSGSTARGWVDLGKDLRISAVPYSTFRDIDATASNANLGTWLVACQYLLVKQESPLLNSLVLDLVAI